MTNDPITAAREYLSLWEETPLTPSDRALIGVAIAAIQAVNKSVFSGMENLALEPCEMFLKELAEGDCSSK